MFFSGTHYTETDEGIVQKNGKAEQSRIIKSSADAVIKNLLEVTSSFKIFTRRSLKQEGYTFTPFHEDKILKSRSLSPEIKALVLSMYSLSENMIQPAISAKLLIVHGFFFVLIYFKRSGFPVTA